MRTLILFLSGIFPFLFFDIFMGPVLPPAAGLTVVLSWLYALFRRKKENDEKPSALLS